MRSRRSAESWARVTVSLTYEPGRTAFAGRAATFAALAPLADEHRRLAPRAEYYAPASRRALSHLERSLFEPDASREDPGGAVRLLEGGGERAELELVAREIARLLGEGTPAEEIAVVVRASPAGADLLEEVFLAAGIPVRAAATQAVLRHLGRRRAERPAAVRGRCAKRRAGRPARLAARAGPDRAR